MKLRATDALVVFVIAPALIFVAVLAWCWGSSSPLSIEDDPLL